MLLVILFLSEQPKKIIQDNISYTHMLYMYIYIYIYILAFTFSYFFLFSLPMEFAGHVGFVSRRREEWRAAVALALSCLLYGQTFLSVQGRADRGAHSSRHKALLLRANERDIYIYIYIRWKSVICRVR